MEGAEGSGNTQQSASRRWNVRNLILSARTNSAPSVREPRPPSTRPPRPAQPLSDLRRWISRRSPGSDTSVASSTITRGGAESVVPSTSSTRRFLPFTSPSRSPNPRFSYIHQQTVTSVSDGQQEQGQAGSTTAEPGQQEQGGDDGDSGDNQRTLPTRVRYRLSQMSNFLSNVTTPRNRAANPRPRPRQRPFFPRPRAVSVHEPLSERDIFDFHPPEPAEMDSSREQLEDAGESEYEHGFTPRRRRLRPRPVVGEPHDEDYVRRREDMRRRRATWAPSNPFSIRELSSEDLSTGRDAESLTPTDSSSTLRSTPRRPSGLRLMQALSSSAESFTSPESATTADTSVPRPSTPAPGSDRLSIFRPFRQLTMSRRNSSRTGPPSSTIPLAELQRLLASYAEQSSNSDYNGHQETTVDGGTITIYGIRRVTPRSNEDDDDEEDGLFPPPTASYAASNSEDRSSTNPPRSRRRPRRIFNFIGPSLGEIDPLPPEFEETFSRLRRARRPRSMFGSGSLRRNGVVEPDVSNASSSSAAPASQSSEGERDRDREDETWIFYIVSAVLPEGHPLLSAPSLFTDEPTYEDMLFLDSFLQKPVASRRDIAAARGVGVLRRNDTGQLLAETEEGGEVERHMLVTERCLVCLSEWEEEDEVRTLAKCQHLFHRECIDTWLTEGRNSCPLCRGEGVEKKRRAGTTAGPSGAPQNTPVADAEVGAEND